MSNLTTFEVILESAASDMKHAAATVNQEIFGLATRATRVVNNAFGTSSKISDLGFVQSALDAAKDAGARFTAATAALKQLQYVGRMLKTLTDARFTEVTGLDATTYLPVPK